MRSAARPTRDQKVRLIVHAIYKATTTPGGYGVVGQAQVAKLVSMGQAEVGALMKSAVAVCNDLYPGYRIQLEKTGSTYIYRAIKTQTSKGLATEVTRWTTGLTKMERATAALDIEDACDEQVKLVKGMDLMNQSARAFIEIGLNNLHHEVMQAEIAAAAKKKDAAAAAARAKLRKP